MEVANAKQQKHFVLVHGACHGAWCWYKLKPLLESAGHKVTAVDLSASGINMKSLHELHTFQDYSAPLMELMAAMPPDENVVLVGHSFGGISLALAMEHYPEKISVAVFLAAFMPDSDHAPSYPLDKYFEWYPIEFLLDTQFSTYGSLEESETSMLFGTRCISSKLYQKCSSEDLELAKMLIRTCSLFLKDLSSAKKFSIEGFGSVERAYIVCNEDKAIPLDFQLWLVQNIGVTDVKEIKEADHMAMLSTPEELFKCLLEIANK